MMKCPHCGSGSFKEARQCPRYEREPVCITCCHSCEYYFRDTGCRWYAVHPPVIDEDEKKRRRIMALDNQIRNKRKQIEAMYKRNRPKFAEKMEQELWLLLREKKGIEHESKRTEDSSPAGPAIGSGDYRALVYARFSGNSTGSYDSHPNSREASHSGPGNRSRERSAI